MHTWQDYEAASVILTALCTGCFWMGSRIFATRKDLACVSRKLEELKEGAIKVAVDVDWIKSRLAGNEIP